MSSVLAANSNSVNEKINLGFVGVAERGFGHLEWFGSHSDVEISAICDVDDGHLQKALQYTGGQAKAYKDFRKLLMQKDLDAVIISTPPHWHAIIALAAMEAGKDVYCEKPMSRFPAEARAMAQSAKKNQRVTQVGTQVHATTNYHRVVKIVKSGVLGQITAARIFITMDDNSEGLGNPADSAVPEGLNWDMWLGPAPETPFNIGRFRDGMHRYFKDYADSWLHELGPHIVDLPVWALELKDPLAVSAAGGRFATESIADVPDTMDVIWEYPGMNMTFTMMQQASFNFGVDKPGGGRKLGVVFHGKKANLLANYDVCELVSADGEPMELPELDIPEPKGHEREFLDAIRTREECSCSFENHYPLHLALNLAHVALNTGRKLHWDAERFECTGDPEATKNLTPTYRAPWKL